MISKRLVLAGLSFLITLHYLHYHRNSTLSSRITSTTFSLLHRDEYQTRNQHPLALNQSLSKSPTKHPKTHAKYILPPPPPKRANATLFMLARNNELWDAMSAVQAMEDRFNREYEYPWVFLNDEPFSELFISRISALTKANVTFGMIPAEQWNQPEEIDESRATFSRSEMVKNNVMYGGSVSYRNMCRFNSGFFFHHPLLQPYRYYWRVEPSVKYFCSLDYDPFLFMEEKNKTYGFTITMQELKLTVPSLWGGVREFTKQYPHLLAENNSMGFISKDGGETYNFCHFWSNFEIADMDFYRSEAYTTFFNHLDKMGGFYYERWGDAPIHSIAASLLLPTSNIHFFNDIGYYHNPFQHCPQGEAHVRGKCTCDPNVNFDYQGSGTCMNEWDALQSLEDEGEGDGEEKK